MASAWPLQVRRTACPTNSTISTQGKLNGKSAPKPLKSRALLFFLNSGTQSQSSRWVPGVPRPRSDLVNVFFSVATVAWVGATHLAKWRRALTALPHASQKSHMARACRVNLRRAPGPPRLGGPGGRDEKKNLFSFFFKPLLGNFPELHFQK